MKCSTCSGTSCASGRHGARSALALVLVLVAPLAALAQSPDDYDYVLVGAAVRSRPAYDGSGSQRGDLIPVLRYYGSPWFARTTQGVLEGGARTELAPGLVAGAQLAYEAGRLASESGFLSDHNVPDIKPGASFGLHLEWDVKLGPTLLTLLARGRQHLDSDLGARADLRASVGIYGDERILAAVFVQGTWANEKSAQSFYGVTPQQSTTLSSYDAGSGPLVSAAGLLWSVNLSREWLAVGSAEVRRLEGDAARSPLAERGSNWYASVGLSYLYR